MKMVSHILIILLAASIIAGAAYGLSQLAPVQELLGVQGGNGGERPSDGDMPEELQPDQAGEGFGHGEGMAEGAHSEGGPGGRFLVATGKNLVTIGIVLALVVIISLVWEWVRKVHRRVIAHQSMA